MRKMRDEEFEKDMSDMKAQLIFLIELLQQEVED